MSISKQTRAWAALVEEVKAMRSELAAMRRELAALTGVPVEQAADEEPLTTREAAKLVGCHPMTIKRACMRSELEHTKTEGGHYRIKPSDVRRWAGVQ
jgi:excisionase family DNA binding protein